MLLDETVLVGTGRPALQVRMILVLLLVLLRVCSWCCFGCLY